jgi:excisionase family DNA binding protein
MTADIVAVDVREAARRMSVSPRTVTSLIARRQLPSRKVGRRRIIPVAALETFILGQTESSPSLRRTRKTSGKNKAAAIGNHQK